VRKTIGFLRVTVLSSVLFFALRSNAASESDLTGYWKYSVKDGGTNSLEFKQAGEQIFAGGRNGMPQVPYGTLSGDKLHLEIPSPFGSPDAKRFTAEPERMHTGIVAFHEALVKSGIDVKFYESPGTAHEWQTWRRDLNLFARLLFQQGAK
jgi:acetyl esterase/lipase